LPDPTRAIFLRAMDGVPSNVEMVLDKRVGRAVSAKMPWAALVTRFAPKGKRIGERNAQSVLSGKPCDFRTLALARYDQGTKALESL
jgi:hypothetical protein